MGGSEFLLHSALIEMMEYNEDIFAAGSIVSGSEILYNSVCPHVTVYVSVCQGIKSIDFILLRSSMDQIDSYVI